MAVLLVGLGSVLLALALALLLDGSTWGIVIAWVLGTWGATLVGWGLIAGWYRSVAACLGDGPPRSLASWQGRGKKLEPPKTCSSAEGRGETYESERSWETIHKVIRSPQASMLGLILVTAVGSFGCSDDCVAPLTETGVLCPASFELLSPVPCPSPNASTQIIDCPEHPMVLEFALYTKGGNTNLACFYDRTSHSLIGAHLASELRVYCGDDSYTEDSGVVVLSPCNQANSTHLSIDCQMSP